MMVQSRSVPHSTPRFTLEEAAPLLSVMSKLHRVVVVDEGRFFDTAFPHICWVDAPPFVAASRALVAYPGSGRWVLLQQLPRRCLVAQPNAQVGEPFPITTDRRHQAERDLARTTADLEKRGFSAPWGTSDFFVDSAEFRAAMVAEIPKVAEYLEQALALANKKELGVEISHASLDLPLMEDRNGPGRGVVLAADPVQYARNGVPTSTYDRTLHFWITDEEALNLSDEISRPEDDPENVWPLLFKVSEAKYGGLVIAPEKIPALATEAERLKIQTDSASLQDALERILSVCTSARNYQLGIYVRGE